MKRLALALFYGVLSVAGIVSLAALVWAAIPSGSYVQYTSNDTVLMPAGTTFSAQLLNVLGGFTASSSLTVGANMSLTGIISPAQITAQQNNYNPTGLSTAAVLRLSSNAVQHLTGLVGGTPGRLLLVHNIGTQNLVFDAESASSTTTTRFDFPGDLTLIPKAMVVLQYDGTDSRWRTSYPTLTAGPVNASLLNLTIQTGDPSPVASTLILYAKAGGVHTRDAAGNIVGPFGTGGGGGTGNLSARLVTTTQTTLSGQQTIDVVLTTAGTRVFVTGQTTPTENGLWVTGTPWTRATDAAAGAAFTAGTLVAIYDGTLNGGTVWEYRTSGAYGSSVLTATKAGHGAAAELVANKNAATALGYAGLTTAGKQIWTQRGDAAIHAPISAPGQITPTASTMRVSGSGTPPVTMSSGDPRILGCATAADDGKELTIEGSDATNTLTMPNGQGVQLCGNTGSITFGLNLARASFVCDGLSTPKVWRQSDCQDLQQAFNISNKIVTGSTEATGFQLTDPTGVNRCTTFWDAANGNVPTTRCFCSGTLCPQTNFGPLPVGGSLRVLNNASTPIFTVNENGTIVGANFGKAVLGNSDFGTVTCPTAGTPRQYPLIGSYSTTVLNEVQMRMPRAGTMANLYARSWAAIPAGDAVVLTLQKAGANTALTCPMNAAATTCEDTTHSVSVAAGDLMSLQVTCTGSTSPIGPINFTLTLE